MAGPTKAELQAQVVKLQRARAREKAKSAREKKALAEALAQQAATTEILDLIRRSPTDVQPVLQAVAERAVRLCESAEAGVFLVEGESLKFAAGFETMQSFAAGETMPISRGSVIGRSIIDRDPIHVVDLAAASSKDFPLARKYQKRFGHRSILCVPLMHDGRAIGAIVLWRYEVRAFSDSHIALVETFANQAVIAIENVRLFNELEARNREVSETLERQTATAEILRVIASSPSNIQPVFDAIAQSAARLFRCGAGVVVRDGESLDLKALANAILDPDATKTRFDEMRRLYPLPFHPESSPASRAIAMCELVEVIDTEAPDVIEAVRETARRGGFRSSVHAPMVREGQGIGIVSLLFEQPGVGLNDQQRALLTTFADQAVIAIENVRLFNETKEALERQTATAEILKVIASSPSDVQPVFDAIVRAAAKLCDGRLSTVLRVDGEMVNLAAHHNLGDEGVAMYRQVYPTHVSRDLVAGCAILDRTVINLPDALDEAVPTRSRALAAAGAFRAVLVVPMLREGEPIGIINVSRAEPGPFSEAHVNLLKTFADQAVIAIENVRLFNETKEALERQTATAEILKVISESPTDVQPVFDAIVESCTRLLACNHATLRLVKGDRAEFAASNSTLGGKTVAQSSMSIHDDAWPTSQAVLRRAVVQIPDTSAEGVSEQMKQRGEQRGFRSLMVAPLLRDNDVMGTINVHRATPGRFADKEIALLETFASQAVIAIENVRLFNELEARNRQVTKALDRQKATSEILEVISRSQTDLQPVFDTIAANAMQLCDGDQGIVGVFDGELIHLASIKGRSPEEEESTRKAWPRPPGRGTVTTRAVLTRSIAHVFDVLKDPEYELEGTARAGGWRSVVSVPMLRGANPIGVISVTRRDPVAFSDDQIALLKTFADQAVIAIENVRLFNETKEALERQTATAEILKVISESPTDTQPVFDAIAESARKLFSDAEVGITLIRGDAIELVAAAGLSEERLGALRASFPRPLDLVSTVNKTVVDGQLIHYPDVLAEDVPAYSRDTVKAAGVRAMLGVPLLREGRSIGGVFLSRATPGAYTEHQIALLKTFADQAVIAIENVRLFKELQQRTEALTKSVGQLTALGDVSQAISSTLDLDTVLPTIVSRAVQLTGLDGGAIYEYEEAREVFTMRAGENVRQEILELDRSEPIRLGEGAVGRAAATRQTVQVPDIAAASGRQTRGRDVLLQVGARALLAVPLLREGHILGALAVIRNTPGEFPPEVVALLETFATQSAIAIQNARLFREIEDKSRQLEVASEHKSQFLASMSHELRTPLNAILGLNEMMLGEIYGEVSEDMKPPLAQTQASGKHLLSLINNVLDLAKIEANRMELALAAFVVQDLVASVRATLEPLAKEKGLEFVASAPDDLPLAHGDAGRLTQCLINLAGNSIKFTKEGRVAIAVESVDDALRFSVADTGIGIPADKIESLFTEFKQTDATIASEYGGTGLGLAITKKFIEMHGGRIWVESELGKGSVFIFEVPLQAETT